MKSISALLLLLLHNFYFSSLIFRLLEQIIFDFCIALPETLMMMIEMYDIPDR